MLSLSRAGSQPRVEHNRTNSTALDEYTIKAGLKKKEAFCRSVQDFTKQSESNVHVPNVRNLTWLLGTPMQKGPELVLNEGTSRPLKSSQDERKPIKLVATTKPSFDQQSFSSGRSGPTKGMSAKDVY